MKKNIVIEQVQPVGRATREAYGAQALGEEKLWMGFLRHDSFVSSLCTSFSGCTRNI